MAESRSRRKRGSLSAEEIVAAALSLLDREGESALTFARLGQELSASPTAVYRHFASRADLVVGLADHLDELSLDDYEPSDDWRADLVDLAWRAWRTAVNHPAAAAEAMGVITNGIHELRAVDAVLRALHQAGLRGREAVVHYQVYTNLVLGSAQSHAMHLARVVDGAADDAWVQIYTPRDPSQYPYAEAVKAELRLVDPEEVFGRQLDILLSAITAGVAAAPAGA